MPYFFCPPENIVGVQFELAADESHHIRDVLRKKQGDIISIFDGLGNVYEGVLTELSPLRVIGRVISHKKKKTQKVGKLSIYVSIPKKQKIDEIIDKLSQLGVDELHPIISSRTVIKPSNVALKLNRWSQIAIAASKQSGRSDVLTVFEPAAFFDVITKLSAESLNIMAWESESTHLKQILKDNALQFNSINLFIGPEGGFTSVEVDFAKAHGFKTAGLGENILKTELAAIYAAIVISEFVR